MVSVRDTDSHEALQVLYDRYRKRLFGFVFRMLNDSEPSKDIIQDVFLKIYQNRQRFNSNYRFYSWIFTITRNTTLKKLRDEGRHQDITENLGLTDNRSASFNLEQKELSQQIEEAIQLLTPPHKEVVIMRFIHKMQVADIAKLIDCSEGTVKSRLFYATQQLTELLKQEYINH